MIINNIKYIKRITTEVGLNKGHGYSRDYIIKVLSKADKRSNKEIELISQCIEDVSDQLFYTLSNHLTEIEDGKAYWIRISKNQSSKPNLEKCH